MLLLVSSPLTAFSATLDVATDSEFNANDIIADADLLDVGSMTEADIQSFLQQKSGFIAGYTEPDPTTGEMMGAARIIGNAAREAGINPEILLALLQKEQSLVEDPNPSAYQFDWATGYSKCDGCKGVEVYRGFGNQVRSAARRLRYIYDHPAEFASFRAGSSAMTLDGFTVMPANQATSSLYVYNPWRGGSRVDGRLIGANYNFFKIWKRFFKPALEERTLVRESETSQWFMIQSGRRRPFVDEAIVGVVFGPSDIAVAKPVASRKLARFYPLGDVVTLNDAFAGAFASVQYQSRTFAGSSTTATITFKNLGVQSWEKETLRLQVTDVSGAPSLLATKQWPNKEGDFHPNEDRIVPGESATFVVPLAFPKTVRGYDQVVSLRYDPRTFTAASTTTATAALTRTGSLSVFGPITATDDQSPVGASPLPPASSTPIAFSPQTISGTRSSLIIVAQSKLQAGLIKDPFPIELKPGEKSEITLKLKNTGDVAWKRTTLRFSAYGVNGKKDPAPFWHKSWRDKVRVAWMKETLVKPGETGTFTLTLQAPKKEGTYIQRFQLSLHSEAKELKEFNNQPVRIAGIHPEFVMTVGVTK